MPLEPRWPATRLHLPKGIERLRAWSQFVTNLLSITEVGENSIAVRRSEFAMLSKFDCLHLNHSFPKTPKPVSNSQGVPSKSRTYVVCLDCGKNVPYDWKLMRVIKEENKAA